MDRSFYQPAASADATGARPESVTTNWPRHHVTSDKISNFIKRRPYILFCVFILAISNCYSQTPDTTANDWPYRVHFSGSKGKWHNSGQRIYDKDSLVYFYSDLRFKLDDESVFSATRIWYHTNGKIKRSVFIDFKSKKKAKIVDKEFSETGKLIRSTIKKAVRTPEQNRVEDVWTFE